MELMIEYLSLKKITALHKDEITEAVNKVIESGWYLQGQALQHFEDAYATYIGTSHCIGCGNGLDAIWLILRAYIELGVLKEGDEIIVPANTYIGTILPITQNRLKPVLIEPNIDTLQIDIDLIEKHITPNTKAVMIVHLYGRCAYTDKLLALCKRYNLKLIEDNAQAHGCFYNDKHTGALGDAAAHSFYPGKNLGALGDGGAVTTNDIALAEMVRMLGNYGSKQKYKCEVKGRNSRLEDLHAAVLSVKLKYLDEENHYRRELASIYLNHINNHLVHIPHYPCSLQNVYHIFPILSVQRDSLQNHLLQHGVGTLIHYPIPPHQQTCYTEWNALSLPITEQIHQQELSLPLNPTMTKDEVYRVVEAINCF